MSYFPAPPQVPCTLSRTCFIGQKDLVWAGQPDIEVFITCVCVCLMMFVHGLARDFEIFVGFSICWVVLELRVISKKKKTKKNTISSFIYVPYYTNVL